VYVPKLPIVFDSDGKLLIFEASHHLKRMPRYQGPSYIFSMASAMIMMDAFVTIHYIKGMIFSVPFLTFLVISSYMSQQTSVIVSKIELLQDK
jgi:hypothetical protein